MSYTSWQYELTARQSVHVEFLNSCERKTHIYMLDYGNQLCHHGLTARQPVHAEFINQNQGLILPDNMGLLLDSRFILC